MHHILRTCFAVFLVSCMVSATAQNFPHPSTNLILYGTMTGRFVNDAEHDNARLTAATPVTMMFVPPELGFTVRREPIDLYPPQSLLISHDYYLSDAYFSVGPPFRSVNQNGITEDRLGHITAAAADPHRFIVATRIIRAYPIGIYFSLLDRSSECPSGCEVIGFYGESRSVNYAIFEEFLSGRLLTLDTPVNISFAGQVGNSLSIPLQWAHGTSFAEESYAYGENLHPALEIQSLSINAIQYDTRIPAPIPEPSTWAMVISGLLLVAFTSRWRKLRSMAH